MNPRALVFRYALFAAIATVANLGVQRLILNNTTTPTNLALAILMGTIVGLVVKYMLDKRWIFFDHSTGIRSHSLRFSLYSLNGVFTTAIFWLGEIGFWYVWQSDLMREIGALIGLTIGYVTKYQLDRRFVFTAGRQEEPL